MIFKRLLFAKYVNFFFFLNLQSEIFTPPQGTHNSPIKWNQTHPGPGPTISDGPTAFAFLMCRISQNHTHHFYLGGGVGWLVGYGQLGGTLYKIPRSKQNMNLTHKSYNVDVFNTFELTQN